MSLYAIAEASLTTAADRRRRPVVDKGQVGRTLALCVVLLVGVVIRLHLG